MEKWDTEIKTRLDKKLEGTKDRDIRFYRIDEFKRNIERVETFSRSCPHCSKQKIHIAETVDTIDKAVNTPGRTRRNYDRLISNLSRHMQKEHGFYAPYYYTYLFSFFGMVAGLLIGYLAMKFLPQLNYALLSLGFVAGLITGYAWGNVKDNKVRSDKKVM